MTRNSTRKKKIRNRMEATGEPYSVAAKDLPFGVPSPVGKEACPGHLTWSAFGASYPDTVCASALEWQPGYQGYGLCDADDDFCEKGIPCPFCDPDSFMSYEFGGGYYLPYWAETTEQVPDGASFNFHEVGNSLWISAEHPAHGELKVTVIEQDTAETEYDYETFQPFRLANGEDL
jgi:hypothetical protein